jgi:hypothetical protein
VYCAAKNESLNIRQISKRLRCYGHSDTRNNERMPKPIVTARMEGTRKRKRPQTRFEENGNRIFAYSGQTPKGMQEDFTGSHDSQQPVVLQEREEEE